MRLVLASAATVMLIAAAAAAATFHAAPGRQAKAAATDAVPGLVWHSGTATMRLTAQPCPIDEFARALELEGRAPPRAYVVQQGSRQFTGCWSKDVDGDVITMEVNREPGSIPISWFHAS
ncbi:MAG TPA: hypothetical protein VFM98_12195 [Ramlibacter sp.]|uniref:hypothetical protein n=1 Tax=Ramlibacter sp. TaxID=1917967 RepID=UPI002D808D5F|nr:hypothetical protein [Ramlibacter sp.]HET8746360.1 hypothetical protein [Ramlibacter sp.]